MRGHAVHFALTLVVLAAGCVGAPTPTPEGSATPEAAPSWSFTDTEGRTHHGDAYAGAPVVVFVMATWCSSCRAEAPRVAAAAAELSDVNVSFLSVGFDPSESDAELRAWAEEHGHAWPHGVDADRNVSRALEVRVQSTVVVLDGQGTPVFREFSPASEAIVRAVRGAT